MDSVWLAQLRAGDQESWQRFLVAYHHVFCRAVGIGLWRLGQQSMPEDRRRLAVVAMKGCREALKGSHGSTWDATEQGEGRFRAYLFHTVVKSLHEQSFVTSGSGGTQHPPALQWQHDVEAPGAGVMGRASTDLTIAAGSVSTASQNTVWRSPASTTDSSKICSMADRRLTGT